MRGDALKPSHASGQRRRRVDQAEDDPQDDEPEDDQPERLVHGGIGERRPRKRCLEPGRRRALGLELREDPAERDDDEHERRGEPMQHLRRRLVAAAAGAVEHRERACDVFHRVLLPGF